MRKRWTRRARPTRTSSRPVANGSRVPACPALRTPSSRLTASVMSCEVLPGGLSTRTSPSIARGSELLGELLAQEGDELFLRHLGGEPSRLPVPPATSGAGDDRHVDLAVGRPQRDLLAPRARRGAVLAEQVARERGDLRALDRAQVVDDALGVALLGAREAEVVAGEAGERQSALVEAPDVRERPREQLELREG